jgi:hypothetical protein
MPKGQLSTAITAKAITGQSYNGQRQKMGQSSGLCYEAPTSGQPTFSQPTFGQLLHDNLAAASANHREGYQSLHRGSQPVDNRHNLRHRYRRVAEEREQDGYFF